MKVLLLQDDKKLGRKGDIVNVSDGYATSALIPMGKVKPATPDIIAQANRTEQNKKEATSNAEKDAQETARALQGKIVVITAKAEGKTIFGSIGAKDVAEAIKKEYNVTIDDAAAQVDHIKEIGDQEVMIDLDHNVTTKVTLKIVAA